MSKAAVLWFHGLGDVGAGWRGAFSAVQRERPGVSFHHPDADEHPVTINGGALCTSWFDILYWPVGLREPAEPAGMAASVAKAHGAIEDIIKSGVPSKNIVIGGFSQGGALAMRAALTCRHPLAGVVSISGWSGAHATEDMRALAANAPAGTQVLFCCGKGDPVVDISVTSATGTALKEVLGDKAVTVFQEDRGMHQPSPREMGMVTDFMVRVLAE